MTIEIRGLTHIYTSASEPIVALAGLDLDLPTGSVTVVRGPNGSGKSTLVSVLRGALAPSAGTITHRGSSQPVTATIAQFGNVIADLTAAEHLALLGGDARPHSEVRASELSRAEQQQLAAVLVGSGQPGLVLADEPAASLSHDDAVALYATLAERCRAAGATLLLVTHDYRAESIADRVVRLRDGRISEVWEPGQGERQAIDKRGWIRLPDDVRARYGDSTTVDNSDTVTLLGAGAQIAPRTRATGGAELPSVPDVTLRDVVMHEGQVAVSGECMRGSVTHIKGPAGSGTSALLRGIAGVQTPASGTISRSQDPRAESPPAAVLVSSELPLGGRQSLDDMGVSGSAVETLDLGSLSRRPLDSLSGGQRQRALIAVALSRTAQLTCIDEPTVNLDPHWRDRVMEVLRAYASQGHAVVLATHDEDTVGPRDGVIATRH